MSYPNDVTISIPIDLLQQIKRVGPGFAVKERFCRTEISDEVPSGHDLYVYGGWKFKDAEKAAKAMTKLMGLLQKIEIPDFQI